MSSVCGFLVFFAGYILYSLEEEKIILLKQKGEHQRISIDSDDSFNVGQPTTIANMNERFNTLKSSDGGSTVGSNNRSSGHQSVNTEDMYVRYVRVNFGGLYLRTISIAINAGRFV